MISVTKTFEFESAHLLPDYEGPCGVLHGHSYKLEIEVDGPPVASVAEPYPSIIVDFKELKEIVRVLIIDRLDHSYLNEKSMFRGCAPTAETMVDWISSELLRIFKHHLRRVRLWETSTSYAEWRPD